MVKVTGTVELGWVNLC